MGPTSQDAQLNVSLLGNLWQAEYWAEVYARGGYFGAGRSGVIS